MQAHSNGLKCSNGIFSVEENLTPYFFSFILVGNRFTNVLAEHFTCLDRFSPLVYCYIRRRSNGVLTHTLCCNYSS